MPSFQKINALPQSVPNVSTGDTVVGTHNGVAVQFPVGSLGGGSGGGGGGGTGSVTAVGLSMPAQFTVTGSPVTTTGTLTASWASQSQNLFLASPNGSSGTPTFRGIATGDFPASGVTSGTYGDSTHVSQVTVDATGRVTSATNVAINAGSGTVTSVGLAMPGIFTVSGSPVTTSGTLTAALASQTQNLVFASPNGSSGTPTFRALVSADIPALNYVTSVGLSAPGIFTVSGSPVTSSGTLSFSVNNQTANTVWAGPTSGGAAAPTFRALVTADLPGGTGTVTSVAQTVPSGMSVSGSPITTSGTLAIAWSGQIPTTSIPAFTGDVTTTAGSTATTIAVGAVTDAKSSLLLKPRVEAAWSGNVASLSGTTTLDSVALAVGDIVLLTGQTTGSQNGPWVVQSGAWTRPTWYPSGGTVQAFQYATIGALKGYSYGRSEWYCSTTGTITIDTTSTAWVQTTFALNSSQVSGLLPIANGGTNAATTSQNYAFIGPTSGSGAPSFRALVAGDIPSLSYVTSVAATVPSGMSISGSPITSSGTLALSWSGQIPTTSMPALTGDVTTSAGAVATTIGVGVVTEQKAATGMKPAVNAVGVANVASLSGTTTIDGVALVAGQTVLLTAQSTGSQNGPWTIAASAWTRPNWYTSANTTQAFQYIYITVLGGTSYGGSDWYCSTSGTITIDTTSTSWSQVIWVLSTNSAGGTLPIANGGTGAGTTSQNYAFIGPTSGSGAPSFRALVAGDIPSLSATYLPLAGGTMSGQINMGSQRIVSMADPTGTQDAVTLNYFNTQGSGNYEQLIYAAMGSTIKAQTLPWESQWNSGAVTSQLMVWNAIWIPKACTITGVGYILKTAGNFTANNENSWSLYSYSGGTLTRVAVTANSGAIWTATADTYTKVAFQSTYSASAGLYFLGYLYSASGSPTTTPSIYYLSAKSIGSASLDFTNSGKLYGSLASQTSSPSTQAMSGLNVYSSVTLAFLY